MSRTGRLAPERMKYGALWARLDRRLAELSSYGVTNMTLSQHDAAVHECRAVVAELRKRGVQLHFDAELREA
jgi:hypothetical protein